MAAGDPMVAGVDMIEDACVNDQFEPNDDITQAWIFHPSLTTLNAMICGEDIDHYRITLREDQRILIRLDFRDFASDLDLFLLQNSERIASSVSLNNYEEISMNLSPGRYYVQVSTFLGANTPYTLSIRLE